MYDRYAWRGGNYVRCREQPGDFLSKLLPQGLDAGDLLLLGVLLLLYLESRDEEFLILLAVLFFL